MKRKKMLVLLPINIESTRKALIAINK